uniref:Protein kinase domain-containing protein n=1 Tax=Peronospora matthiolae TaxID=2874970 RepID=A0AAV1T5U3_9STRA
MNNYHHLQLLGHGGYASVYLVKCSNSCDLYALKRISKSKVTTEQQKKRLEAEKQILQQVKSPFLCQGFTSFETVDEILILLEYVEGRALYECVWNYRDTGKFSETVTKYFAAQLVLALKDLHAQGYLHGDLKSGNVLVEKDGFVKVIDFGLARGVSDVIAEGGGRTLSMCGTHYIMAPEIRIRQQYGFAVDWWSLGVVIYEMVIGRPPWEYKCPCGSTMDEYFEHVTHTAKCLFHGADERSQKIEQGLSIELRLLIRGLLTIDPNKRLGTNGATEVMDHAWFLDISWDLLEKKDKSIAVPYDAQVDFNAARIRVPDQIGSLSSAESIDPEDNAKYFADF